MSSYATQYHFIIVSNRLITLGLRIYKLLIFFQIYQIDYFNTIHYIWNCVNTNPPPNEYTKRKHKF